METIRIGILGGGKMGEAIIARLVADDASAAHRICVADRTEERRTYLAKTYGVAVSADNTIVATCDLIILAIKPQDAAEALKVLHNKLAKDTTVLSIMAGVPVARITEWLGGHTAVIRAMPNTPAQIGKGMTGWYASEGISEQRMKTVKDLLCLLGEEIRFATEDDINKVTALSGSGPAYVFAFLEALVSSGVQLGLSKEDATKLAVSTAEGVIALYRSGDLSLSELRERVTSKGGTTAAGLAVFEKSDFSNVVRQALEAAYTRAKELERIEH